MPWSVAHQRTLHASSRSTTSGETDPSEGHIPWGRAPKVACTVSNPRAICSRASCGQAKRGGSDTVGIARCAHSVSTSSGRIGWYMGEQVISTCPRWASARQRGTMREAMRLCASSNASFSCSLKPRSFLTSSATIGSSRRAAKPIQASMKCTWRSRRSWAVKSACFAARSIWRRSVPRLLSSSE